MKILLAAGQQEEWPDSSRLLPSLRHIVRIKGSLNRLAQITAKEGGQNGSGTLGVGSLVS